MTKCCEIFVTIWWEIYKKKLAALTRGTRRLQPAAPAGGVSRGGCDWPQWPGWWLAMRRVSRVRKGAAEGGACLRWPRRAWSCWRAARMGPRMEAVTPLGMAKAWAGAHGWGGRCGDGARQVACWELMVLGAAGRRDCLGATHAASRVWHTAARKIKIIAFFFLKFYTEKWYKNDGYFLCYKFCHLKFIDTN